MKAKVTMVAAGILLALPALADKTYTMRVDGLACPYCAYGIEKNLKRIDGVREESIDVDLQEGIVRVTVGDEVEFTEPQMTKLFNDAGFTYRSMQLDEGA